MEEVHRQLHTEEPVWCFQCRKRRMFYRVVMLTVEPSNYGPYVSIRCERGHVDGDLFPGRTREYDDADSYQGADRD